MTLRLQPGSHRLNRNTVLRGKGGHSVLVVVVGLLCACFGCGSRSGLDAKASPVEIEIESLEPEPYFPAPERPTPVLVVDTEGGEDEDVAELERGCVSLSRYYPSEPASILLLVDQSGSMNLPFAGRRRWDVLRDAVVDPEVGLLAQLEPEARLGVMFYSSLNGYEGGACPQLQSILPADGSRAGIAVMYSLTEPLADGDTPTGEAVASAAELLAREEGGGPKYIVLITDGLPDTCGQPDPQRGLGDAIAAVAAAFDRGIRVLTVGVSPQLARQPLQWMANAGAGKPTSLQFGVDVDAEPPLTASSDSAILARQLRGAIGDVRSCVVHLGTEVESARAASGELVLDGEVLQQSAVDGWTLLDRSTVEIHGAPCEAILSTGERLEVRFPCDDF